MDNIKFSNNVSVKLASAVSATDTTITTQTLPTGITWPDITEPELLSPSAYYADVAISPANIVGVYEYTSLASTSTPVDIAVVVLVRTNYNSQLSDFIPHMPTDGIVAGDKALCWGYNTSALLTFNGVSWAQPIIFSPSGNYNKLIRVSKKFVYNTDAWTLGASSKRPSYTVDSPGWVCLYRSGNDAIEVTMLSTDIPESFLDNTTRVPLVAAIGAQDLAEYFYVTLMQLESGTWEICRCTFYTQNSDGTWTLTVNRAQENSVATDFTSTAIVENRITAGTLDSMVQAINDQIIITDMISQEELQNIRDVADAIEEIGTANIQDLIDNANEANETAQNTVASLQSVVNSANAAKNAADAAAVTASTMAAQAEDCRDQSCECATESEAAADDAEAAVTAANAAKTAAQAAQAAAESALEGFKSSGVGLIVFQIDSTTETFVKDPLGVDPVSIADDVNGLILDIADGDYALTLSNETVEVPDPNNPGGTVTKNTVALYKGNAEPPANYTGLFSGIVGAAVHTSYAEYTLASKCPPGDSAFLAQFDTPVMINYAAWSVAELPTIGVVPNSIAVVQHYYYQDTVSIYMFRNGTWESFDGVSLDSEYAIIYADTDLFNTGQGGYAALGTNAWVPVIVDTPANAPIILEVGGDNISMTSHSITGLPEWIYVKNLPIDNLTIFSITKPFDNQGNGFYWFRNTWNRLDYTGVGTVQSVDGIQAGTGHDVQLKYSVTKSEFESLQEAGTLIPGARYLVAEEAQSSSSVDNGVPLFSIITSVMNTVNPGYLSITSDNGVLTQAVFPNAYQQLVNLQTAGEANIVSLDDWTTEFTANSGICGKFGIDTGAQTFRIPCAPAVYWRGKSDALGLDVGAYQIDQMRPITGTLGSDLDAYLEDGVAGAFSAGAASSTRPAYDMGGGSIINLDSSLLGDHYSGDDTHPMSVIVDYQMKMYGAVSDAGTLNLTQLITTKANKGDGFPDNSRIMALPYTVINSTPSGYRISAIAPSNGWAAAYVVTGSTASTSVLSAVGGMASSIYGGPSSALHTYLPVTAGTEVQLIQWPVNSQYAINFIPAIGSN